MKIVFEKLQFENFLSYQGKQTLPLEGQGLVSLEGENQDEGGSNRSGKSAAIPDALTWTLFNRTVRGIYGWSVVNRHFKKNCFGRAVFRIGKTRYDVRRYQSHKKYGNGLRLFAEGKEQSHRHKKQTQEKLEKLLGCNYDTFVNSIVFGGAKPFAALSDGEQKKLLQSFLHFEKIDRALKYVREKLAALNTEIGEVEKQTIRCEGRLATCRVELKSLAENEKLWQKQFEKRKAELQSKILKASVLKLKDCSEQVERARKYLSAYDHQLNKWEMEYKTSKRNLVWLTSKKLQEPGQKCLSCGQTIDKKSLRNFAKHLKLEIGKEKDRKNRYSPAVYRMKKLVFQKEQELERWESHQHSFDQEKASKNRLRQELEKQLEHLLKNQPFPSKEKKEGLQIYLSKKLAQRLRLLQHKNILQNQIKDYTFWEQGFGNQGLKALLVRQALPAMNAKLSEYAHEVFGEDATLQFSPAKKLSEGDGERELFHLEYKAKHGADSYLGESSGGRKRVDICVLLVFSWLSQLCNVLLIDELLDGLDAAGKEAVLRILSGLRGTVICISHSADIQSYFSKRWQVTKKGGESRIALKIQI